MPFEHRVFEVTVYAAKREIERRSIRVKIDDAEDEALKERARKILLEALAHAPIVVKLADQPIALSTELEELLRRDAATGMHASLVEVDEHGARRWIADMKVE
jgi:hypothetical protein